MMPWETRGKGEKMKKLMIGRSPPSEFWEGNEGERVEVVETKIQWMVLAVEMKESKNLPEISRYQRVGSPIIDIIDFMTVPSGMKKMFWKVESGCICVTEQNGKKAKSWEMSCYCIKSKWTSIRIMGM